VQQACMIEVTEGLQVLRPHQTGGDDDQA
jgi:hypothetical protein